jgi:excisionase family DNA binding protein
VTFDEVPRALETLLTEVRGLRAEVAALKTGRPGAANDVPAGERPLAVTVETAARLLDQEVATIREWCRSGVLRASKPKGIKGWLIRYADLEAFVDQGLAEARSGGDAGGAEHWAKIRRMVERAR